jgi:DNA-binding transcriptional MocR family regulator
MEQLTPQQTELLNRYHRIHASWLKVETYEMDVMLCAAYASALDLCLAAKFNPFDYPESHGNG